MKRSRLAAPARADAQLRGRQTYAAQDDELQVVRVPGVELVRTGTWHASTGRVTVAREDLEAMLAAAADPEVDHAPVRLGHTDASDGGPGYPSLGWVENLRVEDAGDDGGAVLVGDLVDVPAGLATLMRAAYRRRSVEINWNVRTPSGSEYRAALVGLALLGEEAPAVKGLADVLALYRSEQEGERTAAAELDHSTGTALLLEGEAIGPLVADDDELAWTVRNAIRSVVELAVVFDELDSLPGVLGAVRSLLPERFRVSLSAAWQHNGDATTLTNSAEDDMKYGPGIRRLLGVAADAPDSDVEAALAERGGVEAVREAAGELDTSEGGEGGDPNAQQQQQGNDGGESGGEPNEGEPQGQQQGEPVGAGAGLSAATIRELQAQGLAVVPDETLSELTEGAQAGRQAASTLAEQRISSALTTALSEGRIRPADQQRWEQRLRDNYDAFSAVLSELPKDVVPVEERGTEATSGKTNANEGDDDAYPTAWLPELHRNRQQA